MHSRLSNSTLLQNIASAVQALKDEHCSDFPPLQSWLNVVNALAEKKGVGFLGPSRCGKSSLLNALLGAQILPDSTYLQLNRVKDRGTTSVVTEIIVDKEVKSFRFTITYVSGNKLLEVLQLYKIESTVEKEDDESPNRSKPAKTNQIQLWTQLVEQFLQDECTVDPKGPLEILVGSVTAMIHTWQKDRSVFEFSNSDDARAFLKDYGAGNLPLSVVISRIKLESAFPDSSLDPGTVLYDIPGSDDTDERRAAQRLEGIRQIRKAILLSPDSLNTETTKASLQHLIGANLIEGSLVVKTKFLEPDLVKAWKKNGKTDPNVLFGEEESTKALSDVLTSLQCGVQPPKLLLYDYQTNRMDGGEYNRQVLVQIVQHLNSLTDDESQVVGQLPFVLAQAADDVCTARKSSQDPITINIDEFENLGTRWKSSPNSIREVLIAKILDAILKTYELDYHHWRSARNWVTQLRMMRRVKSNIFDLFAEDLDKCQISLRKWMKSVALTHHLPDRDCSFVETLTESFRNQLSDIGLIISQIVSRIVYDAYVPVSQRRNNSPCFKAPYKLLRSLKREIRASENKIHDTLERIMENVWEQLLSSVKRIEFKINIYKIRVPFMSDLEALKDRDVAQISAILDLVDFYNESFPGLLPKCVPLTAVDRHILQVGPCFNAEGWDSVLQEQLSSSKDITVVILRFLGLKPKDLQRLAAILPRNVEAIDCSGNDLNFASLPARFESVTIAAALQKTLPPQNACPEIKFSPLRQKLTYQPASASFWFIIFDSTLSGAIEGAGILEEFCTAWKLPFETVDLTQHNAWKHIVGLGKKELLSRHVILYFACHGGMSVEGTSIVCAKSENCALSDLIDGSAKFACTIILDSCQTKTTAVASEFHSDCLIAQSAPPRMVALDNTKYIICLVKEFKRAPQPFYSALCNGHRNFTNENIGELPVIKLYGNFPFDAAFWR